MVTWVTLQFSNFWFVWIWIPLFFNNLSGAQATRTFQRPGVELAFGLGGLECLVEVDGLRGAVDLPQLLEVGILALPVGALQPRCATDLKMGLLGDLVTVVTICH